MKYQEVVNTLVDLANRHKMIKTVSYGPISELVDPMNTTETNYPYLFIQPTTHQYSETTASYRFNLIMMEITNEDHNEIIRVQSNCAEYLDDIIAEIYYNVDEIDFARNISVTPFQEKYDDTVSGMTASIELQVRKPLNQCEAPFVPISDVLVYATEENIQIVGSDTTENRVFTFSDVITNDGGWNVNYYTTQESGTYKIEIKYAFQFQSLEVGETYPSEPRLRYHSTETGLSYVDATKTTGWPSNPQLGVTYVITQTWDNLEELEGDLQFVYMDDQSPNLEGEITVNAGALITIEKYNNY